MKNLNIDSIHTQESEKHEQLELVQLLSSKECQILKTGYKTQYMTYYFCTCDQDQKEPMCVDCFNVCHKDHIRKEITCYPVSAVCHCGQNCHRLDKVASDLEYTYKKKCFFMEWSDNSNVQIYYQHNQTYLNYCMFCANLCENISNLDKRTYEKQENELFECQCTGEGHKEEKTLYHKIVKLSNLEEYDFEFFTPTHIINLLTMSDASFHNSFKSLVTYMARLKTDLKSDPNFVIDSNIGYSASMKALEAISILADPCKDFFYFNECLDAMLERKFIFMLLEKKFEYKSGKNIWALKNFTLNLYHKFVFQRDFESIMPLTIKDIENLHPLQRLLYVRTVESQGDLYQQYFGNLKFHPLEKTLNIIEKLNGIKDKHELVYEIIAKCYEIIMTYASLAQFTNEHILRFCRINDDVISGTDLYKKSIPLLLLRSQLRTMIPMIKSLLYLVYYHNDQMLENFLTNQKDLSKVNYFHSNSEVGKIINKNCINVLNYVRNSKRSLDHEAGDKTHILMMSNTKSSNFQGQQTDNYKLQTVNSITSNINFKTITNKDGLREEVEKLTRTILVNATNITSIAINNPDYYLVGLRRLMDKNKELYFNYIQKDGLNLSTNEKQFMDKVKALKEALEESYSNFFKFKINEEELITSVLDSLSMFFNITGLGGYNVPEAAHKTLYLVDDKNNEPEEGSLPRAPSKVLNNKTKTINLNNSESDEIENEAGDKNLLLGNNSENSKEVKEYKIKILINKTLYVWSVIKSIKIFLKVQKYQNKINYDNEDNSIIINEDLLDEVFRLIYFYIENSADNCMMILTREILNTFYLLNKTQIYRFIDMIHFALNIILKKGIQLISNSTLLKVIKGLVLKVSGDPDLIGLLEKLIGIIKTLTEISCVNQEFIHLKLRETIKIILENNPIFVSFKNYLVESTNSVTSIFDRHESIKNEIVEDDLPAQTNSNIDGIFFKLLAVNNENIKNNFKDTIDPKQSKNIDGYEASVLFEIYIKFLKIVNFLFDGNSTLNEIPFLSKILTISDIPNILKKKDIDLSLRIEILKFFRMSSIDVIIDKTKLKEYRSLFVNQIHLPEEGGLFEDGYNYKFFKDLLLVNHYSLNLGLETAVIKYELKYFQQIIDDSGCRDTNEILEYFTNGIILPLFVYINKFMAIIYNLKGYEYLKLYEIVVYFLRMKKFLIENRNKLDQTFSNEPKNIFKKFIVMKRNRYSMINKGFTREDLIIVLNDIDEMCKPTFEILNYKVVYGYFEKHLEGFIKKPKSESLKIMFEKQESTYSEQKTNKLDADLKGTGMKTSFEKNVYDAVFKYENDKNKFDESAFIQNLGEHNIQIDSNYRAIILKSVFFQINDVKLADKYRKQNFWHLFKLLQYDTVPTQNEIYALYEENKDFINLPKIVDLFLENLLSLIFASCNPSTTANNEDYFIAITIVKIIKYTCEEHNIHFQTIFFQELKFDFISESRFKQTDPNEIEDLDEGENPQISLFDLLLGIIGKITVLAKWDKVKFETEENSISYFYDIFFVTIELLIEMVQGTSSENLEEIAKNSSEEDMNPFLSFLQSVKTLLFRDKNDSEIVYQVRKVLIDFIVAFLEEKATPKKVISLIASVYNPFTIFETIVNTLKKLYFKKIYPDDSDRVKEYNNHIFDHKKCQFFVSTYFSDMEFCQTPEFELSNRLYQYVKLLATQYENEDAIYIIESIKSYQEHELIDLYTKKLNKRVDLSDQAEIVLDDSYVQNYFAVKFFEKITRSIIVQKDNDLFPVLFTLNPLVPYLSKNTKTDFFENVNRETRYTKLFSLIEYSDYFFDEINYNASKLSNSLFMRQLNKINYYYSESLLFLFTIVINLIMILKLNTAEVASSFANTYPIIEVLAIIELVLNSIVLCCWFISKFPLYYIVETKKYVLKNKMKEEDLNIFHKAMIMCYNTVISKSETKGFIWNIVFSTFGASGHKNIFLFSIQLLIIINLSITLKNIIKSVTLRYKQLLAAAMFVVIMLYVFSCIAFFYLAEDFVLTIGGGGHRILSITASGGVTAGNQENQCGSLLYCFLTHLDYGLRTDGGIAEHLKKVSFTHNPGYFIGRFLYEVMFFIVMIVVLLSIVFGIIIDTFAELREETGKVENDKKNFCYICGAKREDLEKNCINYNRHVNIDHDVWTYVDYIIGLKFVDPQETNAINSHVIEMIDQKSISWFPSAKAENKEEEE